MKIGFTSINEYIAACPEQSQAHLQTIRETISALAPEAREKLYRLCRVEESRFDISNSFWQRSIQ
jgi:hypothetical protein